MYQMSLTQRGTVLSGFGSHETMCCLLGPKSIASTGLNLTAANVLIEMEPCCALSEEKQCVGRLHRTLQNRTIHKTVHPDSQGTVFHYVLLCQGTMDVKTFRHARVRQDVQSVRRDFVDVEMRSMMRTFLHVVPSVAELMSSSTIVEGR